MAYFKARAGVSWGKRKDAFYMLKNGLSSSYAEMSILDYNDGLFSVSGNELTALKSVNLTVIFSIVNARLIFYVDGVSAYTYNAGTVTNTTVTQTFSVSQGSKIKITARYENGDFVGYGASAYATID